MEQFIFAYLYLPIRVVCIFILQNKKAINHSKKLGFFVTNDTHTYFLSPATRVIKKILIFLYIHKITIDFNLFYLLICTLYKKVMMVFNYYFRSDSLWTTTKNYIKYLPDNIYRCKIWKL